MVKCGWRLKQIHASIIIAWLMFGQKLDLAGVLGIGLIVAGVVVLNLFSKTSVH